MVHIVKSQSDLVQKIGTLSTRTPGCKRVKERDGSLVDASGVRRYRTVRAFEFDWLKVTRHFGVEYEDEPDAHQRTIPECMQIEERAIGDTDAEARTFVDRLMDVDVEIIEEQQQIECWDDMDIEQALDDEEMIECEMQL